MFRESSGHLQLYKWNTCHAMFFCSDNLRIYFHASYNLLNFLFLISKLKKNFMAMPEFNPMIYELCVENFTACAIEQLNGVQNISSDLLLNIFI